MNYLTLQEATQLTGKSESSIRRFVKNNKDKKEVKNAKKIIFEPLKTGYSKVLIDKEFLHAYFKNKITPLQEEKEVEPTEATQKEETIAKKAIKPLKQKNNHASYLKIIGILEKELEQKNKHIDALMQRQYETNVILEKTQSKLIQYENIKPHTAEEPAKKKSYQPLTISLIIVGIAFILALIGIAFFFNK